MEKLKKDIEKFIVILTMTDRTWRQKVIIDTEDLNGTTNLYEESHLYNISHNNNKTYSFQVYMEKIMKTDHMPRH